MCILEVELNSHILFSREDTSCLIVVKCDLLVVKCDLIVLVLRMRLQKPRLRVTAGVAERV